MPKGKVASIFSPFLDFVIILKAVGALHHSILLVIPSSSKIMRTSPMPCDSEKPQSECKEVSNSNLPRVKLVALPPGARFLSKTRTRLPSFVAQAAAVNPPSPAPITIISKSINISLKINYQTILSSVASPGEVIGITSPRYVGSGFIMHHKKSLTLAKNSLESL